MLRRIAAEIEWSAGVIRTLSNRTRGTQGVCASRDVDWRRAEVRSDCVHLPIAENKLRSLAPTAERRQGVHHVTHGRVTTIEIRIAPVTAIVERITRRVSKRGQRHV